jgi:ribosomal protein S18 acetylase RimI-like enzyme
VAASLDLAIRPLTPETWDALAALFREGGDPRWCWCQFWRLRSKDFAALKVPDLRERLHAQALAAAVPATAARISALPRVTATPRATATLPASGPFLEPPGLVAFRGDRAVGWVSMGPREDYERIVRSRVIPRIDDRPVWSIVCFAVSRSARGQGVGRALLDAAVDFAAAHGARTLEAYPTKIEAGERINPESAYTGTVSMFERAGFVVVAEKASDPSSAHTRVVVRREFGGHP